MKTESEALRSAIDVYRDVVLKGEHYQPISFHLAVFNDTEHTLARCTGMTPPESSPSGDVKGTLLAALREIYTELMVLCMGCIIGEITLAAARRKAAKLLGIQHRVYQKVRRTVG